MPYWGFDLAGSTRRILGRKVHIEEQLTEATFDCYAQRLVLALGRYVDTGEQIMLKIRYDLRPDWSDFMSRDEFDQLRDWSEEEYLDEAVIVEEIGDLGHGPKYIDHGSQQAGSGFPYAEGKVRFIVMSRVPGENLADIHRTLSDEQLESIRVQLAKVLEHMRQLGYVFNGEDPAFLRYERENDKLFIVDYTYIIAIDPTKPGATPITVDSPWVMGFPIWRSSQLAAAKKKESVDPKHKGVEHPEQKTERGQAVRKAGSSAKSGKHKH